MKCKYLSVIFLLLLTAGGLQAQKDFTLPECIDFSLQNHRSVELYRNNIQIAREQSTQALSIYLPQVNGMASAVDNLKLATVIIPAGVLSPKQMAVQFGQKYNNNLVVDLTQTLYDQSKIYGIKAAKPYMKLADIQNSQNQETLIYSVAQAFFQVLVYQELENKLRKNISTYEGLLKIAELQYAKGVVLQTDIKRITVALNAARFQLNETINQQKLSVSQLKNAMGFPLDSVMQISNTLNLSSYTGLPEKSMFNRDSLTEFGITKANTELQKINYQAKKAAFIPSINSSARWGNQAYGQIFSKSFDTWYDYSYIGLSINVPIFSGLRRKSQVSESRLNYLNSEINMDLTVRNLQLRYENANKELLTSYDNWQNARNNFELAESIYSSTSLAYQKGAASLTDFLSDDNAVKNAQTNYVNGLYSLMISRLNLEKSKGTLFSFYQQLKQ
jgi:outer membrane protein